MTFLVDYLKVVLLHVLCYAVLAVIVAPAAAQLDRLERLTGSPARTVASEAPTLPAPHAGSPIWPAQPARFQLFGGLFGSAYSVECATSCSGNRASTYLGLRYFLTPVIDEDAPRSLQPFLQRTSSVDGYVSGGGFLTTAWRSSRTYSYVGAAAGVDAYLTPHFALTGAVGYAYDVLHDGSILDKGHSLSGDAGLGIRFGDARIDASYGVDAYNVDGTFTRQRWGTVALSAYIVFARAYVLTVAAHVADGGGGGSVELGAYTNKDFGFFVGASARTFLYAASDRGADRYTASARISHWVGPSTLLDCEYAFRLQDTDREPPRMSVFRQYEHALSLGLLVQLP